MSILLLFTCSRWVTCQLSSTYYFLLPVALALKHHIEKFYLEIIWSSIAYCMHSAWPCSRLQVSNKNFGFWDYRIAQWFTWRKIKRSLTQILSRWAPTVRMSSHIILFIFTPTSLRLDRMPKCPKRKEPLTGNVSTRKSAQYLLACVLVILSDKPFTQQIINPAG